MTEIKPTIDNLKEVMGIGPQDRIHFVAIDQRTGDVLSHVSMMAKYYDDGRVDVTEKACERLADEVALKSLQLK